MTTERISTVDIIWAMRTGGGGRTERRYLDFVIDGVPLSSLLKCDVISPFGWTIPNEQVAAVDRLVRRKAADLPEQRVSLYVCPECGDLGCGAVSVQVEGGNGVVTWRDFAFQNNYDDSVHREGFENVGPFVFEGRRYHQVLEQLRQTTLQHGV
jgi:hypothetical protein